MDITKSTNEVLAAMDWKATEQEARLLVLMAAIAHISALLSMSEGETAIMGAQIAGVSLQGLCAKMLEAIASGGRMAVIGAAFDEAGKAHLRDYERTKKAFEEFRQQEKGGGE